jgi:hypothetical protein
VALADRRAWLYAALNALGSVAAGLGAAGLGLAIGAGVGHG